VKRAFTLIELLVVIAIIAILAAILFPVFAQAKMQAKGASSLSNTKQHSLALLMYTNDSDDVAVQDTYWVENRQPAPVYWNGDGAIMWTWAILPYTKNSQILIDPLTQPVAVPGGWGPDAWNSGVGLEYGYDYTVFSPTFGVADKYGAWIRNPITMTSIARPSDIVLFTEHQSYNEMGAWWYGPGTIITLYGDEPPNCATIPQYCFNNWGEGTWFTSAGGLTDAEGANTGLIPFRKTNTTMTAFSDGHSKAMNAGALAAGTNWTPTLNNGALVVTNINVYHWTATP